MLNSCADSLPHSQLLSCSVSCVLSFGHSFLLTMVGQTLLVHLSGLWSSALCFILCMGVVTKVRAAWQSDRAAVLVYRTRSSANLC